MIIKLNRSGKLATIYNSTLIPSYLGETGLQHLSQNSIYIYMMYINKNIYMYGIWRNVFKPQNVSCDVYIDCVKDRAALRQTLLVYMYEKGKS